MPLVHLCYFLGHCYSKRVLSPCLFTDKSHSSSEAVWALEARPSSSPGKLCASQSHLKPCFLFCFLGFAPTHHVLPTILTPVLPQHHRAEIYCLPMFLFSLTYAFSYDSVCLALGHTLLFFMDFSFETVKNFKWDIAYLNIYRGLG